MNSIPGYMEDAYLSPPQHDAFYCPCCGRELGEEQDLYLDEAGNVIGCDMCIRTMEVYYYIENYE